MFRLKFGFRLSHDCDHRKGAVNLCRDGAVELPGNASPSIFPPAMSTSTLHSDRKTAHPLAGESAGQLASLFDALRDGVIVAASCHRQGVVRLVVENKPALGHIADSWQRLVVTLSDCDTFRFETHTPASKLEDPKKIGARALRIKAATNEAGHVRITCETPFGTGVLWVATTAFALMLGSGRTVSATTLLQDLLRVRAA